MMVRTDDFEIVKFETCGNQFDNQGAAGAGGS
jgi:hypothetical protein